MISELTKARNAVVRKRLAVQRAKDELAAAVEHLDDLEVADPNEDWLPPEHSRIEVMRFRPPPEYVRNWVLSLRKGDKFYRSENPTAAQWTVLGAGFHKDLLYITARSSNRMRTCYTWPQELTRCCEATLNRKEGKP